MKREIDEGKKHVYEIYTLHLVQWKEVMFADTQTSVMGAVLRLVERQRNGETIEHSQIKSVVDSFISLGIDETDSNKGTLEVYKIYFETPFINQTSEYYTQESRQFLADNSVVEYMKKAEARLAEEKEHVGLYLINEIMTPLMKACNQTLIANHQGLLRDEFQVLLDNDRLEDLGRMYKLLQRIPEGLDPLRTCFEKHVMSAGKSAVEKVLTGTNLGPSLENLDPKAYVDALLTVHSHYSDLVSRAFGGESEFVRSLDSACKEYVNHNKVCEKQTNRSPELLAKYSDTLLKKSAQNAEEDDLETQLNQIVSTFQLLLDQSYFALLIDFERR